MQTLRLFDRMSLADVMQPAIKHAARGSATTPYLHERISENAGVMERDLTAERRQFRVGDRVMQAECAETLRYTAP